jgi:hypothetical protein
MNDGSDFVCDGMCIFPCLLNFPLALCLFSSSTSLRKGREFCELRFVEEVVWLARLESPRVEQWPAEFVDVVAVVAREDASETIDGGVRVETDDRAFDAGDK